MWCHVSLVSRFLNFKGTCCFQTEGRQLQFSTLQNIVIFIITAVMTTDVKTFWLCAEEYWIFFCACQKQLNLIHFNWLHYCYLCSRVGGGGNTGRSKKNMINGQYGSWYVVVILWLWFSCENMLQVIDILQILVSFSQFCCSVLCLR
jgi:hypothetical protein